jgi:hypothetical protein
MPALPQCLTVLLAASFLVPPAAALRADDASELAEAASAGRFWLDEIDSGRYEQSYNDAGPALHDKMPQDTWVKILKTERPPMGKVVNRQEITRSRHTDGIEGVQGDFVVIGYRTNFQNRSDELEYVVLKREFGGWRGVGYDFGPEQVEHDSDAGPVTTTESSTNAPPTPTNGIVVPAQRGSPPPAASP